MSAAFSKRESATLRGLANEAWEAELHEALEGLFEDFCQWADHGYSSMELAERIHEFHNGAARDLYKRYTGLPLPVAVARAVAIGVIDESVLSDDLQEKLAEEIESHRRLANL